jgi:Astacin (Peptidase family M12A)
LNKTCLSATILLVSSFLAVSVTQSAQAWRKPKPQGEGVEVYGSSAPAKPGGSLEIQTPEGRRQIGYEVYDGIAVAEGDIILGKVEDTPSLAARTAQSSRWFCAIIPFTIDPKIPNQARVTDAMAQWQASAGVRFVPRTTETDFLTFQWTMSGCSSPAGRQGGQQFLYLADTCSMGNAMHEIGHTLGLWHEQSRSDRDRFVTILWANIEAGREDGFRRYRDLGQDGADIGPYDFGSLMHYPADAFSSNGMPTIRTAGGAAIGQRVAPSVGDITGLRESYPQLKQETFCRGTACGPTRDLCGRVWNCPAPTLGEACGYLHCGEQVTDGCGNHYTCGAPPAEEEFCARNCGDVVDECGNSHSCPPCPPPPPTCLPPNELCCDGTCARVCGICPP